MYSVRKSFSVCSLSSTLISFVEFFLSALGTFKIQKTRLQKEGFDPRATTDQIYFLNSRAGRYEAVNEELYDALLESKIPL